METPFRGRRVEVKRNWLGVTNVHYDCPRCKESLFSPIRDVGSEDTCPSCSVEFVVPGTESPRVQEALVERQRYEVKAAKRLASRRARRARQLLSARVLADEAWFWIQEGGYRLRVGAKNVARVGFPLGAALFQGFIQGYIKALDDAAKSQQAAKGCLLTHACCLTFLLIIASVVVSAVAS